MAGITVKTLDKAGDIQLGGGQNWVFVEGQPVILLGDKIKPHGGGPHGAPFMAEGVSWVTIDGVPVVCAGKLANCKHPTTGRSWVNISE